MTIGLRDIDPDLARRIREMLDYMRTMGFQDHQHPLTPERDAQLGARTVLQRTDTVPLVLRWASSVGVGFLTLFLVAGGINCRARARGTNILAILVGEQAAEGRRLG